MTMRLSGPDEWVIVLVLRLGNFGAMLLRGINPMVISRLLIPVQYLKQPSAKALAQDLEYALIRLGIVDWI
jgi:hypothetical protein